MKSAIFLADGVTQVVLTAETPWEKSCLAQVAKDGATVRIFRGGFYHCQGGWFRESPVYEGSPYGGQSEPESLILRVDKTLEVPDAP